MNTPDSKHFLPTVPRPTKSQHKGPVRALKATSAAAYSKDLRHYREGFGGTVPCDGRTVERYIASLRNRLAPTTIFRRAMALRYEHIRLGHPSPTDLPEIRPLLRQLQKGIVPSRPSAKAPVPPKRKEPRQAKPITRSLLEKMVSDIGPHRVMDRRDRCLLLLGFATALSRSLLVSLDVGDLVFTKDVLVVHLREYGDPTRTSRTITVPITGHEMCAATALKSYVEHAALDMEGGALFRNCDRAGDLTKHRLGAGWCSVVVKDRLQAIGVDPKDYSGLSLKRGRLMEMARGKL